MWYTAIGSDSSEVVSTHMLLKAKGAAAGLQHFLKWDPSFVIVPFVTPISLQGQS